MEPEARDQRSMRLRAQLAGAFEAAGSEADATPSAADVDIVRAPRCVYLMGDHTDPNDGLVLGAAIGPETWLAFRRRRDGFVRLAGSRPMVGGEFWIDAVSVEAPSTLADPAPIDFAAGAAWSLREAGLPIRGMDGVFDAGDLVGDPAGGHSGDHTGDPGWCTALELSVAMGLIAGAGLVEPALLAALAHRGGREYVGRIDGMADHFLATAARSGRAVLLDCRSLDSHLVPLPAELRLVVCDTGAPPHPAAILAGRRADCGRALTLLAERMPGLMSLRDLDPALLWRYRTSLPETLALRTEHVVSENLRVMGTAAALAESDFDRVGRLFAESHQSLRSLFDVGSPQLDVLVEIATSVPGTIGSRMTGQSGTRSVTLALADAVPELLAAVEREYPRRTGLPGRAFEVELVDGAGPVA